MGDLGASGDVSGSMGEIEQKILQLLGEWRPRHKALARSYEFTRAPAVGERVETGPIQFGTDWPGVFVRGDEARAYATILRFFAQRLGYDEETSVVGALIRLLLSCQVERREPYGAPASGAIVRDEKPDAGWKRRLAEESPMTPFITTPSEPAGSSSDDLLRMPPAPADGVWRDADTGLAPGNDTRAMVRHSLVPRDQIGDFLGEGPIEQQRADATAAPQTPAQKVTSPAPASRSVNEIDDLFA